MILREEPRTCVLDRLDIRHGLFDAIVYTNNQ